MKISHFPLNQWKKRWIFSSQDNPSTTSTTPWQCQQWLQPGLLLHQLQPIFGLPTACQRHLHVSCFELNLSWFLLKSLAGFGLGTCATLQCPWPEALCLWESWLSLAGAQNGCILMTRIWKNNKLSKKSPNRTHWTDPEKTWESNSSIATYLGVRW